MGNLVIFREILDCFGDLKTTLFPFVFHFVHVCGVFLHCLWKAIKWFLNDWVIFQMDLKVTCQVSFLQVQKAKLLIPKLEMGHNWRWLSYFTKPQVHKTQIRNVLCALVNCYVFWCLFGTRTSKQCEINIQLWFSVHVMIKWLHKRKY